jgi:SAM-dependent methyltransferase
VSPGPPSVAGNIPPMPSPEPSDATAGIDYQRLYEFRFQGIAHGARQAVWNEIAPVIHDWMGSPGRVLDPAAGYGEFVNAIPAQERWIVDMVDYFGAHRDAGVKVLIGDARTVELPRRHFDGVFVSNLLEHFASQEEIGAFLQHLRSAMAPGGHIAILGPNFKYCASEYFDCADHTLALTHLSVEEHLYAAGFTIRRTVPRFLPYSFRGKLPPSPVLVRWYLRFPPAWRVLGKQFLLIAENPGP